MTEEYCEIEAVPRRPQTIETTNESLLSDDETQQQSNRKTHSQPSTENRDNRR